MEYPVILENPMSPLSRIFRKLIGKRMNLPSPRLIPVDEAQSGYDLEIFPSCDASKIGKDGTVRSGAVVGHEFQLGPRHALVLGSGESLRSTALTIGHEHVLWLFAAAAPDAPDPVELTIRFVSGEKSAGASDVMLSAITVGPLPACPEQAICLDLHGLRSQTGHFRITNATDVAGSACMVAQLRVCPRDQLGRTNALSSYAYRMRSEVQHFSGAAYTHEMYGSQVSASGNGGKVLAAETKGNADSTFLQEQEKLARDAVAQMVPNDKEAVFSFALRCLGALLPQQPPNFFDRAASMSAHRPLRILSICAGAARIEEMILARCKGPVELTLLDASEDLIQRAAQRLQSVHADTTVTCLIGDINNGLPGQGQFDVIVCVSALHHVADLERVLAQINERLADDGEFWSIGEQIGRNGNRLWPEAARAASAAMGKLPERLRKNAHTNVVDAFLNERDFSIDCFEGIRSEELETKLEAYLVPKHVYKRNAFLWRMVDATYSDNYSLQSEPDVACIRELVVAEALHWVGGGRATELHGVYTRKKLKTFVPQQAGD